MHAVRFSVVPASYVYLLKDGEVLLQQRKGTGYMDGMWVAGAAGHVELGETAAATAVREVREELGVEVRAADLRSATVMQRTDGTDNPVEQRADWFFTVRHWHGEPAVMEPHKCAAIRWFPLNALPDAVPAYERFVLDGLASGTLAAVTSHGFRVPRRLSRRILTVPAVRILRVVRAGTRGRGEPGPVRSKVRRAARRGVLRPRQPE